MPAHTIHCHIDRQPGSLQRLIGLVEHRGFRVDELNLMAEGPDDRAVALSLSARDDRCFGVLGRQIDRLYGVRRVTADGEPVSGGRQA